MLSSLSFACEVSFYVGISGALDGTLDKVESRRSSRRKRLKEKRNFLLFSPSSLFREENNKLGTAVPSIEKNPVRR